MDRHTYSNLDEIIDLIRGFESGELPRSQWTHQVHLTVGGWYLSQYTFSEAIALIRNGIQYYNHCQGIVTTKDSGYHETITMFWVKSIAKFLASFSDRQSEIPLLEKINLLLDRYQDKQLPFQYYSRELLISWEARSGWVDPDLLPL